MSDMRSYSRVAQQGGKQATDPIVAALYLSLMTVLLAALSRVNLIEKDPWSIGDWLINYQGGFVRRGLPGEAMHWLANLVHVPAEIVVAVTQVALYGCLLFTLWRLLNLSSWSLWIKAFLFSPATLSFPILDFYGGFRKEIILLAGLALLLRLLLRGGNNQVAVSLYVAGVTVLLVLSHEALLLFLPYWFAALAIRFGSVKKAAVLMLPAAALGLVGWFAVVHHAGDAGVAQRICTSLGDGAKAYCTGAVASLAQNRTDARQQVLQMIAEFHPMLLYTGLAVLGVLPGVLALIALWKERETRWHCWVVVCCSLASMALTSVLFLYATDWGRWIYIHVSSLFLVLLWVDITRRRHTESAGRSAPLWSYVLLLIYATTWGVPRMPELLPRPTGYLGHLHLF